MSQVMISGGLNRDHLATSCQATADHQGVWLATDAVAPRLVPHDGATPLRPGEKRNAHCRLPEVLRPLNLPTSLGGGLSNTLEAMAATRDARGLRLRLTALAGVRGSPDLEQFFGRLRADVHFLGKGDLAENLVFSFAQAGDRGILRDPVPGGSWDGIALPSESWRDATAVVLNSVKLEQQFLDLTRGALMRGLPQVVALTGSPSWARLIEASRQPNNVAVFGNWSEWCCLFERLGQPHELAHLTENELTPGALQDLAGRVWQLGLRGDVICTLGRSGAVVGDEATASAWWVGLADGELWAAVQAGLAQRPEARNALGDWLLGCWVAHRWGAAVGGEWPASVAAAVKATRDVLELRGLVPASCGVDGFVALPLPAAQTAALLATA